MQCMNLDKWVFFYYLKTKFPATRLSIRETIWKSREFYRTKLKRISRENVLVSHEDSFWLTSMRGFCLCATWWIQRNPTSQKEFPGMEQSAYNAEPRLTTIFVFLHFYQVGLHTMTWSIQFTSHTCTHSNSRLSSSKKVIWPWNHSDTSSTKQTPIRTHAYQSPGNVNQALQSTVIMFYWTLSQYLEGLLGPFNSVTCVPHSYLERCWFYFCETL